MFLIKELVCCVILMFIIIVNTFVNYLLSNMLFTLFYITSYTFVSSNLISLLSVTLLGAVFDSINNIKIGTSSTILIILTIIYNLSLQKGMVSSLVSQYLLGIVNIIVLTLYIKILQIFLHIPFISLITFNIIAITCLFIMLPIVLITNKIFTNAK